MQWNTLELQTSTTNEVGSNGMPSERGSLRTKKVKGTNSLASKDFVL